MREKERALAELKRMREEANEATETWRARLERESGAREKVEGELRELQLSSRAERDAAERAAAGEAERRRRAVEEEKIRVEALEKKLQALQESSRGASASRGALESRLKESEVALARAEAKMARMRRDLEEAEEELELRDEEEDKKTAAGAALLPPRPPPTAVIPQQQQQQQQQPSSSLRDSTASIGRGSGGLGRGSGAKSHPIFSRVRNNRHAEVEAALVDGTVDVNIVDQHGNSLLAVATQNNRKRIVKACVRAGVPLDAQNAQGQTAMHYAYAYGYVELAEYLVRKGANPMLVNQHGLRPDEGLSRDRMVAGSEAGGDSDDDDDDGAFR